MSIRSLSDDRILSRTRRLVRYERIFTVRVLSHLNEIEERRLHLDLGYRSMLDFCVRALGYARSSAGRRITAARCMKRFPEVRAMLEANEANVVTVACVAGVLTAENKDELLGRIRGRTQEEVEAVAASHRPGEVVRDRVREVFVPVSRIEATLPALSLSAAASASAPAPEQSHCGTEYKDSSPKAGEQPVQPEFESRLVLKFSVSKPFMGKLRRFRSLAWHRLPANATMEQVFELLLDNALERNDPALRHGRRGEREKGKKETTPVVRAAHTESNLRRIPAQMRDAVFVRDQGKCTFVGRTGNRCGSTDALQIDHIVPVARGGAASMDNLRLLCGYHNRLEAERILGKSVSRAFESRASRAGVSSCGA